MATTVCADGDDFEIVDGKLTLKKGCGTIGSTDGVAVHTSGVVGTCPVTERTEVVCDSTTGKVWGGPEFKGAVVGGSTATTGTTILNTADDLVTLDNVFTVDLTDYCEDQVLFFEPQATWRLRIDQANVQYTASMAVDVDGGGLGPFHTLMTEYNLDPNPSGSSVIQRRVNTEPQRILLAAGASHTIRTVLHIDSNGAAQFAVLAATAIYDKAMMVTYHP